MMREPIRVDLPQSKLAELPGWEDWTFRLRTAAIDDRIVVTGVEIHAPEGEHLTADLFRRVPIGSLLRLAPSSSSHVSAWAAMEAPDPSNLRSGSPAHLAAVVSIYRYALSQDVPPRAALADHFGVSRVTVDRWLVSARRKGLLGSWADERAADPSHELLREQARKLES